MLTHNRPGDLADIDIAARIDGNPVRRNELTGRFSGFDVAEPCQAAACSIINVHPMPEVRRVLIYRIPRPQFADIADWIRTRAVHVRHRFLADDPYA